MLSKQANLEASNEALEKQARANAANVDLVEKVKKDGKVGILTKPAKSEPLCAACSFIKVLGRILGVMF